MNSFSLALVFFIALQHFFFLYLEMFAWSKPLGRKIFKNSVDKAESTKVLAANQGLYNGFLATGLIWGLFYPDVEVSEDIILFFLSCIIVAGLYGGYSVKKTIWYIQALPAFITLLSVAL